MPAQKFALISAALILTACATAQENPHYQHSTQYKGNPLNSPYGANNTAPTQVAQGYGTTPQGYGAASQQAADISTAPAGTVLARVVHSDTSQAAADTRQVIYEQSAQDSGYSSANYTATTYSAPAYSRVDAACVQQGLQNTAGCQPSALAINGQSAAVAQPYASGPQTLYVTSTTTTPLSPTEQAMPDSYGTPGYEAMKNSETQWAYETQAAPQWDPVQASTPSAGPVPVTQPFASALPSPEMRAARSHMNAPQNEQSFTRGSQVEIQEGDTVYSFARSLCSSVEEIKAMNSLDGNFGIRLGDSIRLPASQC